MDTYTIVLDVDGGTYIDQRQGSAPLDALLNWSENPHSAVLSAFNLSGVDELRRAVEDSASEDGEAIVALSGLQSVWFMSLHVNEKDGFLNLVRTKTI